MLKSHPFARAGVSFHSTLAPRSVLLQSFTTVTAQTSNIVSIQQRRDLKECQISKWKGSEGWPSPRRKSAFFALGSTFLVFAVVRYCPCCDAEAMTILVTPTQAIKGPSLSPLQRCFTARKTQREDSFQHSSRERGCRLSRVCVCPSRATDPQELIQGPFK